MQLLARAPSSVRQPCNSAAPRLRAVLPAPQVLLPPGYLEGVYREVRLAPPVLHCWFDRFRLLVGGL